MWDNPIMYVEICHMDEDYVDECPSMLIEDWDAVYTFMRDRIHRFGDMMPKERLEYYQLRGEWVAGDGVIDLFREESKNGIVFHLYQREI